MSIAMPALTTVNAAPAPQRRAESPARTVEDDKDADPDDGPHEHVPCANQLDQRQGEREPGLRAAAEVAGGGAMDEQQHARQEQIAGPLKVPRLQVRDQVAVHEEDGQERQRCDRPEPKVDRQPVRGSQADAQQGCRLQHDEDRDVEPREQPSAS